MCLILIVRFVPAIVYRKEENEPAARASLGSVLALEELQDGVEKFSGGEASRLVEKGSCWGPSKKKHFGQANLKRGQVN